jgi:hypothetical protein
MNPFLASGIHMTRKDLYEENAIVLKREENLKATSCVRLQGSPLSSTFDYP